MLVLLFTIFVVQQRKNHMKKYLITFFGGNMALRYNNLDKAEKEAQEKHKAAWGKWMAELVKSGNLETGYPLESDGKRIDADGIQAYHFPDTTEGGYVVIKAESSDQAAALMQSAPIIKNGGYILVRPCGEIT
jgi:hypothetical protein